MEGQRRNYAARDPRRKGAHGRRLPKSCSPNPTRGKPRKNKSTQANTAHKQAQHTNKHSTQANTEEEGSKAAARDRLLLFLSG